MTMFNTFAEKRAWIDQMDDQTVAEEYVRLSGVAARIQRTGIRRDVYGFNNIDDLNTLEKVAMLEHRLDGGIKPGG
jgi:hypothetical protein